MENRIYQLKITLNGSKPVIWRRILVPGNILLSHLHRVLQTTMGWTDSHLHQFIANKTFYTVRLPDDDFWDDMNNVDYKRVRLNDLLKQEKSSILYEYDFGDSWEHEILLEKILEPDPQVGYPVCVEGKMSCPPEDVGGIGGYLEMLRILKDPRHPDYESYMDWLDEDFDYNEFDLNQVNRQLTKRNYGTGTLR